MPPLRVVEAFDPLEDCRGDFVAAGPAIAVEEPEPVRERWEMPICGGLALDPGGTSSRSCSRQRPATGARCKGPIRRRRLAGREGVGWSDDATTRLPSGQGPMKPRWSQSTGLHSHLNTTPVSVVVSSSSISHASRTIPAASYWHIQSNRVANVRVRWGRTLPRCAPAVSTRCRNVSLALNHSARPGREIESRSAQAVAVGVISAVQKAQRLAAAGTLLRH